MNKIVLTFFVVLFIATGLTAGVAGLLAGKLDTWSPRDYTPQDGGILVYPQGDPLYDEHYAKDVNVPNSQAYQEQAQARYIQEQARRVRWETNGAVTSVSVMLGIVVLILALVVVATIRG